uniref:Uncharacterized protein n=1 Tax=Anguilla anguilla TaxID=7936 RepID=A0A0E9Q7F7_ANGAN
MDNGLQYLVSWTFTSGHLATVLKEVFKGSVHVANLHQLSIWRVLLAC